MQDVERRYEDISEEFLYVQSKLRVIAVIVNGLVGIIALFLSARIVPPTSIVLLFAAYNARFNILPVNHFRFYIVVSETIKYLYT